MAITTAVSVYQIVGRESTSNRLSGYQITGHLRNLNWRYLPYIRPKFQGISPQNMAKHMVLTNLHFRILKFPLKLCLLIYNPHELYTCIYPKPLLSQLNAILKARQMICPKLRYTQGSSSKQDKRSAKWQEHLLKVGTLIGINGL
jgi:hypothetical protein